MSILDIGIILILLMCFIVGFKRGAIKEAASLIGIVVVFVISFYLMKPVGNFLCLYLPFFKFSGILENAQSVNIIIYQFISFLVEKLVDLTIILLLPSKIIGGIIAFITGYLIIFILLLLPFKKDILVNDSKLYPFILDKTPIISKQTQNIKNCMDEIYALDSKLNTKEADNYTVNLLLKYDIVNKETIKTLVSKNKLSNIDI